jgi:hypothetical protein
LAFTLHMKVEKNLESFYMFGDLAKLIIKVWRFEKTFPSKSKQIWVIFFIKIVCISQNHILQVTFMSIGSRLSG